MKITIDFSVVIVTLFLVTSSLSGQVSAAKFDSTLLKNLNEVLLNPTDRIDVEVNFVYGNNNIDGGYEISPDYSYFIPTLIKYLESHPNTTFEIGIHTDCVGKSNYNLKISEIQAKYLSKELRRYKIGENVFVRGYGEAEKKVECKCKKCTESEHDENSRISILLMKEV